MALFTLDCQVRPAELEEGYHVHHSYALRLLERGRLAFLDHIGVPDPKLRAEGILLVIASIKIRYLRELFDGPAAITVESVARSGKSLFVTQRILNAKAKSAVEAEVECVPLSLTTRRSTEPPAELVAALERIGIRQR